MKGVICLLLLVAAVSAQQLHSQFNTQLAFPTGNVGVFNQFKAKKAFGPERLEVDRTKLPGYCANFQKVWEAYPLYSADQYPTNKLKKILGGQVGADYITNTCAIRTTIALRALGLDPGNEAHTAFYDKHKNYYIIRVTTMREFMNAVFGPPAWRGRKVASGLDPAILGKVGIIRYGDCGWNDASGHFDVWDGYNARDHGYSHCNQVEIWNVCKMNPKPDFRRTIQTGIDNNGARSNRNGARAWKLRGGRYGWRPTKAEIQTTQTFLNSLAAHSKNQQYKAGAVDGAMGGQTSKALQYFQSRFGNPLEPTGELDQVTYNTIAKIVIGEIAQKYPHLLPEHMRPPLCAQKEPYWKNSKCVAVAPAGSSTAETEVDIRCCTCPKKNVRYTTVGGFGRCYTFSSWYSGRVYIGTGCCTTAHKTAYKNLPWYSAIKLAERTYQN